MTYNETQHPRAADGQWEKKLGAPAGVTLSDSSSKYETTVDAIQNSWGGFSGWDAEPESGGSMRFRFLEDSGNVHWEAVVDTNGLLTDVYHKGHRVNSGVSLYEDAEYELSEAHGRDLSLEEHQHRRELNDAIAYQRSVGSDIDAELDAFHQAKDYASIDAVRIERVKNVTEEYRRTLAHPFRNLADSRKRDQLELINLAARRRTNELRIGGAPVPHTKLGSNNPFCDAVNDVEIEERIRTFDGTPADALAYATERKRELSA